MQSMGSQGVGTSCLPGLQSVRFVYTFRCVLSALSGRNQPGLHRQMGTRAGVGRLSLKWADSSQTQIIDIHFRGTRFHFLFDTQNRSERTDQPTDTGHM